MSEQGKELIIISEDYEDHLEALSNNNTGSDVLVRYPLYFGCYKSALTSMFENLERLKEKRNQCSESGNMIKDKYIDFSDMANNIIAFCGGRGSGKTTAIKEFQRILKNFGRQFEKQCWIKELSQLVNLQEYRDKEIWFTVLDSVDASLLIDKEDIIELVLSQMYAMVENTIHRMHYDNDKKLIAECVECFENVYRNYHKLRKGESGELGESAAVILKNMSNGPKIREAFSELLNLFFKLMYSGQGAEQYLVITIDDLDLNIKHGYEMLEQIHKYLSDYRIIVLTAVDFEQLSRVCELYFNKQYDMRNNAQNFIQYIRNIDVQNIVQNNISNVNVEILARDYLLKAIPLSNRIYMMDKRNFVGKVKVVQDNNEREFVKDFIMKKLSRKLGIYFDIKDMGRHFSIPVTVRELVSYSDFLDSLYTLHPDAQNAEKIDMSLYDHNHTRMNRDITERMAAQRLAGDTKKQFENIVEVNVLNRSKFTVDLCNDRISDQEWKVDNVIYQYGNLLESLYRLEENGHEQFKNCILAFFTSEMTREYYSYRYNESKKQMRSEYRLKRFLGAAFGNEWLGEIIPPVPIKKEKESVKITKIGYIKKAQINICEIPVPLYENEDFTVPLEDAVLQSIKRNRIVEILGCVISFCSNLEEMGTSNFVPEILFEIKNNQTERQTKYVCSLSINAAPLDFDLLGFMGKEWSNNEIDKLTDNIINSIRQGFENFQANDGNIDRFGGWREEVWRKLVKNQMRDWFKSNLFVFPFYELDLAYNVLKRARIAGINEGRNLKNESIYSAIQKGYGYIAAELFREDLQYSNYKGNFYKRFIDSPFIRKFGIIYSGEICSKYELKSQPGGMPKMFAEVLGNMIKTMVMPIERVEETLA